MKKITETELQEILKLHTKWLNNEKGGVRANLRGADFMGADFMGADLRHADFEGADLEGADLRHADFEGADLRHADFEGADLEGADFMVADLKHVDFEGAKNYYSFVAYDTSKRVVHCIKHGNTWMIKAGCFWGSLEDLEKKVKETHSSKVYLANIEILKTL